jgi:hypothetical protein
MAKEGQRSTHALLQLQMDRRKARFSANFAYHARIRIPYHHGPHSTGMELVRTKVDIYVTVQSPRQISRHELVLPEFLKISVCMTHPSTTLDRMD